MKRSILTRIIAVVLILCMLPVNAFAAGYGRGGRGGSKGGWWGNWWGSSSSSEATEPAETTAPTETESSEDSGDTQLLLIEDESTVENGDTLRASTYVLTSSNEVAAEVNKASEQGTTYDVNALADGAVLKYFPVTMYDYDQTTINNATHKADIAANANLTEWQGIYFSGGSPAATGYTAVDAYSPTFDSDGNAVIENGTYIIKCGASYYLDGTTGSSPWVTTAIVGASSISDAETMTITAQSDGSYTIQNSSGNYLTIPSNNAARYTTSSNTVNILKDSSGNLVIQDGEKYLNNLGGEAWFGGWTTGSPVYLYKANGTISEVSSMEYASWNWWSKGGEGGQKTWTGLVESTLDVNKDIVFTKPDGGIFNSDATVKSIYTNVEMPFVYENGTYTFDASQNGVYFHEDTTQKSSGTAASNTRLYYNENSTQSNGGGYADGSTTVWAPFNNGTSFSADDMNYHFGMRTTIPFTMTSNGRMNEKDDTSEVIQFSFSGDDDVWVFIDGQLVIDLGGIHNRLDATIDFAANTVTYSESNDLTAATGSYNDDDFELEQDLFGNLIAQDRATFAASTSHELTIFYLERGMGSSNCKIEFNLPIYDSVSVTKQIAGVATYDADANTLSTVDNTDSLTASQIAALNDVDFGFTLYDANGPVAKETYNLLNENGQVIDTPATDDNGHFTLKNGQTAKFVTQFTSAGSSYYVVEDIQNGFVYTSYDISSYGSSSHTLNTNKGAATYTYGEKNGAYYFTDMDADPLRSYTATMVGAEEAEDSLTFVAKNYVNGSTPTPFSLAYDEKIVIDYGLSVEIDLSNNSYYVGDTYTLAPTATAASGVYTGTYGTYTCEGDKITYTLNKQLTGIEVIEFAVTAHATDTDGDPVNSDPAKGYVYIIPATTMYYEENFSDMVTYIGKYWQAELVTDSYYTNTTQEPGVVGTVGDSPYGSDVAYLNDSNDSNGTSKYADTSESAVKFSYTFTGTGTSFYARTTNNSGLMRVTVTDINADSDDNLVHDTYRDTMFVNDEDKTLYNIPVYTIQDLPHGTYTVTVLIYRGTKDNQYGTDFWLDGIRVYQPLDPTLVYPDEYTTAPVNYDIAASAYATDGEANMVNVTLRNKLIDDAILDDDGNLEWAEGSNFVLFTDTNGEMLTAEEYESFGPKEEVYLNDGQSVTFSLYDWDPNTNKLYLGIKAPTGSGLATIGTTQLTINNATDCYYDVSSYATITTDNYGIKTATFKITAGSGRLISVTNIKVSGNVKFDIIEGAEENV